MVCEYLNGTLSDDKTDPRIKVSEVEAFGHKFYLRIQEEKSYYANNEGKTTRYSMNIELW